MIFKMILFGGITSFTISYILLRYLRKNAGKFKIGKRVYAERMRLHERGVPRLGGVAIYVTFYVTLLFLYFFARDYIKTYTVQFIGIFIASSIVMACGLYDDLIKRLSYKIKFASHILAAFVVAISGYNITAVTNPFGGKIYLGIFGIFFVILWIVAIINAINLMDGLDGLACGISIIVATGFFAIEGYRHNVFSLMLLVPLLGSSLAFLRYNFYPARLFLGDSGSFFLGFMLGLLAIESSTKRSTVISLIVPLLTLFIPIGSVIFTFSRRIAKAQNPFKADRKHLHYRILNAGVSHRDTVLVYYTVTFIYAIFGALCFFMPKKFELSIITFALIMLVGFYMWAVHFVKLKEKLSKYPLPPKPQVYTST